MENAAPQQNLGRQMDPLEQNRDVTLITPSAPVATLTHGGRAKCLQRLIRLDLPIPRTVALSFSSVKKIAKGQIPDTPTLLAAFAPGTLLCVRPSSEVTDWGGPSAVLNIGMNEAARSRLAQTIGEEAATHLYLRFVQAYAVHVARLDPDMFDEIEGAGPEALQEALAAYEEEAEEPFPSDPGVQLTEVLRSMARAWDGTTARLLRQAKGAPMEAGLGLVVQEMVLGLGLGECGSGVFQLADPETGDRQITGRYRSQSQGREAIERRSGNLYLQRDPRGASLEDHAPEAFAQLITHAERMRIKLREEMQIEFTIEDGALFILDGVRAPRTARARLKMALRLAEDDIISREEAVLRIEPRAVSELLHRQIAPGCKRDVVGSGIAASPGAASGRLVFTSTEAQTCASRGENCILVRRETAPEDVRGMHAAQAVLTERGGMTSHAAVIARGLGLPCVVSAADIRFRLRDKLLIAKDGRQFREGDVITVDGTSGMVLKGSPPMVEPALDDAFLTMLAWADEFRDIAIRANADTPEDARTARTFKAEGIGLCRTEHMFFDRDRITPMREMIFADTPEDREAALARILPMQRADFTELFRIMEGMPVVIRLFDPPLHEFLPSDQIGLRALSAAVNLPIKEVTRRVQALGEHNPMLGLRGVRLGITIPEIYDMQARAIFEATLDASREGASVVPEIMLPLVSAKREVEIARARIDAVAAAVRAERGESFDYRLGVMVETPRACLRADEIAQHAHFLSFGTNDLTQMTYGLSRDDAGRFMSTYVNTGVFTEDPFHVLDIEGVGELIAMGAERGRLARSDVTLSICGEHGGNPESIAFCRAVGLDYVSCSPFRVPVARLAAAHLALSTKGKGSLRN